MAQQEERRRRYTKRDIEKEKERENSENARTENQRKQPRQRIYLLVSDADPPQRKARWCARLHQIEGELKATTTLNESQAARLEELAAKAGAATASNPAQKRQRHQKKQQHHYTEQQWADWKTKENKQKTQDKKD